MSRPGPAIQASSPPTASDRRTGSANFYRAGPALVTDVTKQPTREEFLLGRRAGPRSVFRLVPPHISGQRVSHRCAADAR